MTKEIHRKIFLFGVYTLPFGIMIGRAPGSWPIIILAANWLLEGDFLEKWKQAKSNALIAVLTSMFFVILFSSFFTGETNNASNEIRIALPYLILPIVFFTSAPLSKQEIITVFYFFIVGCIVNILWCFIYGFALHSIDKTRDLSRFMSHIRLGLFLNLAIAICIYLFRQTKNSVQHIFLIVCFIFFVISFFILGLASGTIIFFILISIYSFKFLLQQKPFIKLLGVMILILIQSIPFFYLKKIYTQQSETKNWNYNSFKSKNNFGRPLIHFDSLGIKENGNFVYRNIQMEDLKKTWNLRVPEDTFSYSSQINDKRYTILLRYLSSAQLTKDKLGVLALGKEDISAIKMDITNINYAQGSFLYKRSYELINEINDFKNNRTINGHSLALRFYYWKAALLLIKKNIWFGVGTGNCQIELNKIYQQQFPKLEMQFYKLPHNQFLSILLEFGLIGFLIFVIMICYPIVFLRKHFNSIYWLFFVILLLSFITEDTLATQAGMAFYTIFNTLFCSDAYFRMKQILEDLPASR